MLEISPRELEKLGAENIFTPHEITPRVFRYDFNEVIEYRKKLLENNKGAGSLGIQTSMPKQTGIGPEQYRRAAELVLIQRKIALEFQTNEYELVDNWVVPLLTDIDLYAHGTGDSFVLFKRAGKSTSLDSGGWKGKPLYYQIADRSKVALLLHQGLISQLKTALLEEGNETKAKNTLTILLDMTLANAGSVNMKALEDALEVLLTAISNKKNMILNLFALFEHSSAVIAHSSRVMAMTMKFCLKNEYSPQDTKMMSLCALLHDVGMTQLPPKLQSLSPPKNLTDEEYILFCSHPTIGAELLKDCGITDDLIVNGALEHHERLDGSGYPLATKKTSMLGQLTAIIDTYDCLLFGYSPEKPAPLEILKAMKIQCEAGKYNRSLFESFAYSLL